jgi:acetyltransferase-like isoleucine patch superfamily enzyme
MNILKIKNYIIRHKIKKWENVNISLNSKVDYYKIGFRRDCHIHIGSNSIIQSVIAFERPGAKVIIGDRVFIGQSLLVC